MTKKQTGVRTHEQKADEPIAITPVEYGGLQAAFDHFNAALFDGKLPDVFITYQRRGRSRGYFSADRFAGRVGKFGKHELALNPDHFVDRTDEQITSTLAHEMVHLWQHAFGKPSSRSYHNTEWAAKMKAIGLMPSSTGAVGGKETGQRVSHYILPGAAFSQAFAALAAIGWKLNLQSAIHAGGPKAPPSKVKFSCAPCDQNAWGKPDLAIRCDLCNARMLPERPANAMPDGSYDQEPVAAGLKVGTIFRGYEIEQRPVGCVIQKDGKIVSFQPTKESAMEWVNNERRKEIEQEVARLRARPLNDAGPRRSRAHAGRSRGAGEHDLAARCGGRAWPCGRDRARDH